MYSGKKQYSKLFYKLLLLAVYFAFFTVQLLLRYTSSHSQQSLEGNNYQKDIPAKSAFTKTFISKSDNKKDKHLSYLNKRFHPKDAVIVPSHEFQLQSFYSKVTPKSFFKDEHIADIKINSTLLRGPPSLS